MKNKKLKCLHYDLGHTIIGTLKKRARVVDT